MLTNFINNQRNESVIDVDATSLRHHLDNVLVVEIDNLKRALVLKSIVSGQLDLISLDQLNLSTGTLKNK